MKNIADLILLHDRKINAPQDDSVLRCTKDDSPIYIRRSRGIAPNVFRDIEDDPHAIVAFGAMLKSTIGLLYKGNTFISQYIGNSNSYETQSSFIATYEHLQKVLDFKAEHIIADKHPGYFTHELAEELSMKHKIALHLVQHHEAHFSAVLGEYNLWSEKVLGIIWDGTGLGNDGNIWGGEIFSYQDAHIERIAHLDYQKHILGDKMVNEPRIAAFSFFNEIKGAESFLRAKFNEQEWSTYQNIHQRSDLFTSSMGRLFDAVASFLEIKDITTFHGQAAMLLEAKASEYPDPYLFKAYPDLVKNEVFQLKDLLENIVKDKLADVDVKETALRFHHSLVLYIECIAQNQNTKIIAFSGGVFQNKLLVELITQKLAKKYRLFFNHQFSPNDESISFGQIMHYLHIRSNTPAI
jgi:hydrogenase maturation protein HypF